MKDAQKRVYICAVTSEHVQFIGPFEAPTREGAFAVAGAWGHLNLDNPCWNTVWLFPHDVASPLEVVIP